MRDGNSSSAGAGTIFATGILRGASFQTRIGATPGSRTGSLFIQPPGIPGSAGFSRTQVFSKSTSLGTSLATCTFQRKVCLEAGGHARTGHLRPQMATWGNSDGHAGQLSREDSSSTQAPSRRRKPGFSARDLPRNLPRACAHAPMLTYVARTVSPLWVGSGSRSDSATPRLRT